MDLISRQAAIDALIWKMQPVDNGDGTMTITMMTNRVIKETLENLPSAQPIIIRCKDCKHYLGNWYCEAWNNSPGFPAVGDNGYCWMAERRTDE